MNLQTHKKAIDKLVKEVLSQKLEKIRKYLTKYYGSNIMSKGTAIEVRRNWVLSKSVDFMEQNGFKPFTNNWDKRIRIISQYINKKFK